MIRRTAVAPAAAGALLLAAGCLARNPATGRTEISFYSDKQEINLGRQAVPSIIQESGGLFRDAALAAYIDGIGQKLVAASDRPFIPPEDRSFRYAFHLLNSSEVNAFALPGGQIFVTRGIIARLSDEAELAAVIGHEIGHVAARHGVHHMQSGMGMELLIRLGAIVLSAKNPDLMGADEIAGAARVGALALQMKYSRDDETQSDTLGMKYAAKAGWDPRGMIRVQEVLKSLQGKDPKAFEALFRSHPPSDDRIENARDWIAKRFAGQDLDAAYTTRAEDFRTETASLREAQKAYARHEEGVKAMAPIAGKKQEIASPEGKKSAETAHAAFDEAIRMSPDQAPFHASRGLLHFLQGNAEPAGRSLERAVSLDGELFEPLFHLGIHRFSSGRLPAARESFAKAAALYTAHPGPYYYLGRISEQEGKRDEAIRHYRRAEAAGPETSYGKEARERLKKL